MDNDENIDTSGISDFAPKAQWAKVPPYISKNLNTYEDTFVPEISRDSVIAQLWVEASDRSSRNQAARIRAWELIAELKGWKESHSDVEEENTDNLTPDEIALLKKEFENAY